MLSPHKRDYAAEVGGAGGVQGRGGGGPTVTTPTPNLRGLHALVRTLNCCSDAKNEHWAGIQRFQSCFKPVS